MQTENERKWIIPEDGLPADMPDPTEMIKIKQAYLTRPERPLEVSIRRARHVYGGNVDHTMRIKGGQVKNRFERIREIDSMEFDKMWNKLLGSRLTKTRFVYPMGYLLHHPAEIDLEVDIFDDVDLRIGEVEFDSVVQLGKYDPPSWFGEEVTEDGAYRNAEIAIHSPNKLSPTSS